MKKRIYFIISSILQIIGAVYIMFNANNIIQEQVDMVPETYAIFSADYQQEMIDMLENRGVGILIFSSALQIILNALVIKTASNNSILRNKGKLIAVSLICFFTAESSIVSILSIVNFIVLLCLKRKNPEDYPEKKEIPHIEYQKPSKKEIVFGLILILAYFSNYLISAIIPEDISLVTARIIVVAYYILLFVLSIVCFKDRLKRDIKLFKENSKAYLQYVLPKLGIMYIIYFCSSFICILLSGESTSVNQSTIESMPLWFTIPLAVVWAPIVEEAIFRGVLRRFIKNNKLFIVTSAIIFGLLHTIEEATISNMIIMAIPYAILGGFFAYIYAKTENITNNVLAHAFHNTIATIMSIVTALVLL